MNTNRILCLNVLAAVAIAGCGRDQPIDPARYDQSDALFSIMDNNVASSPSLNKVIEIDHSRMGQEAGSIMPPARVLIFSSPELEARLLEQNPMIGIDLPLRALAYEPEPGADSSVIYNTFDYLKLRYSLGALPELERLFYAEMSKAFRDIRRDQIAAFSSDAVRPSGIITIDSPFDFEKTTTRIMNAINAQDDTVVFGNVDFQLMAREHGVDINPNTLILFGAPGPGAKAMREAPTLGLDAFCQKFLVWQDQDQGVHLSFNDLLALADRQGVSKPAALRVINKRLRSVFEDALSPDLHL